MYKFREKGVIVHSHKHISLTVLMLKSDSRGIELCTFASWTLTVIWSLIVHKTGHRSVEWKYIGYLIAINDAKNSHRVCVYK